MSQFDHAIDFVLRELDRRRQGGYDDWRATVASVDRLRAARPRVVVPSPLSPMPQKQPAATAPDGPSLLGEGPRRRPGPRGGRRAARRTRPAFTSL